MRIWLINPPVLQAKPVNVTPVVRALFYNSPPIGLASIAAVLEEKGHQVVITDCPVQRVSEADLPDLTRKISPDIVGLTSSTAYYSRTKEAARQIKSVLPETPICLGGPHLGANPESLIQDNCFDFGVIGEGEITFSEVVQRIETNQDYRDVPGVVTAQDGQLNFAATRPLIEDLDTLPYPARHLLPIKDYVPMPNDQYNLPKTSMITSRGCPFPCIFCDKTTFGARYRSFSPGRIVDEMHMLEKDYGIRDIAFVDSTFTPNRKRVEGILEAMEAAPPIASWTCSSRANVLDEDLLRRMKAMNCWRIRIGIESGNEQILKNIRKGVTKQDVERTAKTAYRLGFQLKAFFMIGHFGETLSSIQDSIDFALSLPLKDITIQTNTPLRGTAQYENYEEYGELAIGDQSRYSFFQPVFVPKGLTSEKLLKEHKRFYRSFYLRPIIFWRHLKAIRNLSDIGKYIRALPLVVNLLFSRRHAS